MIQGLQQIGKEALQGWAKEKEHYELIELKAA